MKQRLFDCSDIEVTLRFVETDIRKHQRSEDRRRQKVPVHFRRYEKKWRRRECKQQNKQIDWQDAQCSLRIEGKNRKPARNQPGLDLIDNEEARDYKEYIDADKSARNSRDADMI